MVKLKKLVVASHNTGKIAEIRELLVPFAVEVVPAADLNLPEPEETGSTFEENALLKAFLLSKISGFPCLADDSGLCVNALDGHPGVYTARYAPTPDEGMDKLLRVLKNASDRSAYFACVLALAWPDGKTQTFEGRVDGDIIFEKRGKGFGYDPIFQPKGYSVTFGEMAKEEKNKISHRGRAFEKLMRAVFGQDI